MPAWFPTVLLTIFVSIQVPLIARAEIVSCACEELACKACETEANITFYTSKCGPNNSRVKSCKRPTCVAVSNQRQCLADLQSDGSAVKLVSAENKRKPASDNGTKSDAPSAQVGSVVNIFGEVKLSRSGGIRVRAEINLNIFEGDEIETEKDGKVRVVFNDGNVLNVAPESKITIEKNSVAGGRRKTLLNLIYGKMRTQVNKRNRYDDQTNYFRVKTKSAVACVRGTDFVTTFIPGEKNWITKIQTIEGRVKFGGEGPNEDQDSRPNDMIDREEVGPGQWAAFSIPTPQGENITDMQLKSYILKGQLTKPEAMKAGELDELSLNTDYKDLALNGTTAKDRKLASVLSSPLCQAPQGEFGMCSYTCEGAACAECVRRSCNAGGVWGLPTRIEPGYCVPAKSIVRKQCYD